LPTAHSGYSLARMAFTIVLAPEAVEDLKKLKPNVRSAVRTALETHLRHEPGKTSGSRIKRLRGLMRPQYRLRIGEVRVFYDISPIESAVRDRVRHFIESMIEAEVEAACLDSLSPIRSLKRAGAH